MESGIRARRIAAADAMLKSGREVKRNGGNNNARLVAQGAPQPLGIIKPIGAAGGAVVQELLPAVLDDELGQDDRHREL